MLHTRQGWLAFRLGPLQASAVEFAQSVCSDSISETKQQSDDACLIPFVSHKAVLTYAQLYPTTKLVKMFSRCPLQFG